MPLLSTASAIIFDLDGTLFNTIAIAEPAFRLIVDRIRTEKGVNMDYFTPQQVASFIGHTFKEMWEIAFAHVLPAEEEYVHRLLQEAEQQMLTQGEGRLFTGIRQLLQTLTERGYNLYLASNCSHFYMQPILEKTNIADFFCNTYPIGRYPYITHKGELIELLIAENPQESGFIMVGDREMDLISTMENRIAFIGALWGFGNEQELSTAHLLARSPQELSDLLTPQNLLDYDVVNIILKLREEKRDGALLVGVSGLDNSGKTTLCTRWESKLVEKGQSVTTVHIDDFHNPQKIRHQDPQHPCYSFYQHGFDYTALEERILKPLKENGRLKTKWTGIDLATDKRTLKRIYDITEGDIALVEGVFIFRQALRDYYDLRIFVDISPQVCLERARERHQVEGEREEMELYERYRNRYLPGQNIYLTEDKPKEYSQIIIDNNNFNEPRLVKHPWL